MRDKFTAEIDKRIMSIDAAYSTFAKREGISKTELDIVSVLWEAPEGLSQKDIGRMAYLPKQTVSSRILGLIERGMVELLLNQADGRSTLVRLTAAGREHYAPIVERIQRCEQAAADVLSAEEKKTVLRALGRLEETLRATWEASCE